MLETLKSYFGTTRLFQQFIRSELKPSTGVGVLTVGPLAPQETQSIELVFLLKSLCPTVIFELLQNGQLAARGKPLAVMFGLVIGVFLKKKA
jgi:hypothetical protein